MDDDDDDDGKDEINEPAMEMARNKLILSVAMYGCVRATKRVSIEENYYFLRRARIRHMNFVCPCRATWGKTVSVFRVFCESALSFLTECEWNTLTVHFLFGLVSAVIVAVFERRKDVCRARNYLKPKYSTINYEKRSGNTSFDVQVIFRYPMNDSQKC